MDNVFAQIKTTELKGSTFRSRILDFGDFDISEAEFKIVFKRAGNILSFPDFAPQKVGNTLVIPYNILASYSGEIRMEAWMSLNGITDLAMVDIMLISAENQMKSDATNQNITVTFGDVVIPVTFTQAIVNIGGGTGTATWDSIQNKPAQFPPENHTHSYNDLNDKPTIPQPVDISGKQDVLVSGSNIKTINGENILGEGNIIISGGGETLIATYSDLVSAIAAKEIIKLAPTTIPIEATLVIPPGKTIIGSGKKTVLQADPGVDVIIDLTNSTNVELSDFTLKGNGANILPSATTYFTTTLEALNNLNIGTQIGILVNKSDGSRFINLTFKNFNNSGIQASYVGINGGFSHGVKIYNCSAEHCYNGFYFLNTGEYSQITNCNSLSCVIGIQIRSGNVAVSNSQFTNNRIGGFVGNGSNNGHGSFTGCFFNHNKLRSVLAHGLTAGHVFSGCHAFDGDMEIWNSKGFNWSGGEIACGVIHTSQASARNQISSTVFLKSYNGGTITATGSGSLGLKNNFFIDGSDSTTINN